MDPEGIRQERQRATVEPSASLEAVGEGWEPEDRRPGPAWRDMDGPARRRRAACVLGTVAAIIVAVGALSLVPTRSGSSDGAPGDSTSSQSEDVLPDGAPTTTGPRPHWPARARPFQPTAPTETRSERRAGLPALDLG